MKKLDNPQQAIYDYIQTYYSENGFPPSVREICRAVGLRSTSTVHTHLKNMEQKGLLTRDPTKQRALTINQRSEHGDAPSSAWDDERRKIPLVGKVAAGQPILAVENIEDAFPVPPLLLHGGAKDDVFMLTVQGDSMINAGIHDGDVIVIDRSIGYEDGDIVVARTQEETATVKRIFRENGHIRLQPENPLYPTILLGYEEVEVAGKVTGLMRRF